MPEAIPPSTNGTKSTEFQVQQASALIGNIGAAIGAIIAIGPQIISVMTPILPANSRAALIAGVVLSVASLLYNAFNNRAYIQGRTDIKVAQQAAIGAANNTGSPSSTVTVLQAPPDNGGVK